MNAWIVYPLKNTKTNGKQASHQGLLQNDTGFNNQYHKEEPLVAYENDTVNPISAGIHPLSSGAMGKKWISRSFGMVSMYYISCFHWHTTMIG